MISQQNPLGDPLYVNLSPSPPPPPPILASSAHDDDDENIQPVVDGASALVVSNPSAGGETSAREITATNSVNNFVYTPQRKQ